MIMIGRLVPVLRHDVPCNILSYFITSSAGRSQWFWSLMFTLDELILILIQLKFCIKIWVSIQMGVQIWMLSGEGFNWEFCQRNRALLFFFNFCPGKKQTKSKTKTNSNNKNPFIHSHQCTGNFQAPWACLSSPLGVSHLSRSQALFELVIEQYPFPSAENQWPALDNWH